MGQHINRFIYGSEAMNKLAEYDAYENYDNKAISEEMNGVYCNNDCLNCMLECPYRGY